MMSFQPPCFLLECTARSTAEGRQLDLLGCSPPGSLGDPRALTQPRACLAAGSGRL